MRILMCPPTKYDVVYEINPWMNIKNRPDKKRALKQWQNLHDTYKKLGVKVELIDQADDQPDMVFTANAGIIRDDLFISNNHKHPERKGEEKHFKKWFRDRRYKIKNLSYHQGGEGDALFYRGKLYMGHGFRSQKPVHAEIGSILDVPHVSLNLIDPYFYDFDTAFCPIGDRGFLYYPEAFSQESKKRLEKIHGGIPMTKRQAQHFVGNTVYIHPGKALVSYLDSDLKKKLNMLDVTPIELDMSEYKKAGGGIKCLTLYIER